MSQLTSESVPMKASRGSIVLRKGISQAINSDRRAAAAQGHQHEVNCVATSPQWYIVSGAQDHTTRIWRFFESPLTCYRLVGVIVHNNPVTAVALTSRRHPQMPLVITSTLENGLFLWDMQNDDARHYHMSGATHLHCKQEHTDAGDVRWLLAVAIGNESQLLQFKEPGLAIRLLGTFCEDAGEVVYQVSVVSDRPREGAAIATSTRSCVTFWTLDGQKITVLQEPLGKQIRGFSLNHEAEGWLLVAAGGAEEISVWILRPKETLRASAGESRPAPLVQYRIGDHVRRVAIVHSLKLGAQFIFVTRQDGVSQLLNVTPDESLGRPAVGHDGLASQFVQRGLTIISFEVHHSGVVNDLAFFECPEEREPRLVVALTDGSLVVFDIEGPDAGQKVGELRSLSTWEHALPIGVAISFCVQMSILAFGPTTGWENNVKVPATFIYKLALLDYEASQFNLDGTPIFWIRSLFTLTQMLVFIVVTLGSLPKRIMEWKQHAEATYGVKSRKYKFLAVLKVVISIFMSASVTLLTMPTYKSWGNIYACEREQSDSHIHIISAKEVHCWKGPHMVLVIVATPVAVLYSILLVPHFVVDGDTSYVMYGSLDLMRIQTLRSSARRQATTKYKGFVHSSQMHALRNAVLDLFVKITMPVTAICMRSTPVAQMSILTTIAGMHFILSIVWRKYVHIVSNAFLSGMRLLTVGILFCAILTVIDDGNEAQTAAVLLLAWICVVVPGTAALMICLWERHSRSSARPNIKVRTEGADLTKSASTLTLDDSEPVRRWRPSIPAIGKVFPWSEPAQRKDVPLFDDEAE